MFRTSDLPFRQRFSTLPSATLMGLNASYLEGAFAQWQARGFDVSSGGA
jgi:hypothetical protein